MAPRAGREHLGRTGRGSGISGEELPAQYIYKGHPVHGNRQAGESGGDYDGRFWRTGGRHIPGGPGYGQGPDKGACNSQGYHDGNHVDGFKRERVGQLNPAPYIGICIWRWKGKELQVHD